MIKSLSIRNYALIQSLDFAPSSKLSMITGETGAGKSIMLGAMGLLMGNRADTKVLWDESIKCTVEASFDISHYALYDFFEENDLDYDDECIIRREITPSGKSRAFVNDTPVTLQVLKALSPSLMDIHSQHDGLLLSAESYQLNILDTYCNHQELLTAFHQAYQNYKTAKKYLEELEQAAAISTQEEDYKRFILEELISANLEDLSIDELENELSTLENAEDILANLSETDQLLEQGELTILRQLDYLQSALSKLSKISSTFQEYADRAASAAIELKELHLDLIAQSEAILVDPDQLELVKGKVDLYNRLLQKHSANSTSELIDIREHLHHELNLIDNREGEIVEANKKLNKAEKQMLAAGDALSKSRKAIAPDLAIAIESIIHQIGIENGKVLFRIEDQGPSSSGIDKLAILFSANKGIPPKELKDVASGGEFSRLIFAIKSLLANKSSLPTVIFDEIDTGVSGEIALKMVRLMKQMANNHQVISISHLPQFAAGGDTHFFVYKDHSNDKSVTKVKKLEETERVEYIAKMIGGDQPGDHALKSASELLNAS
jgi:DNA repair protein RecN (Recombination protein N)